MIAVLKKAVIIQKQENIYLLKFMVENLGFPGDSDSKESTCNAGDPGSIPGQEKPLEKGMATHFSILFWRIPCTEEPGGLIVIGSQRVRHD